MQSPIRRTIPFSCGAKITLSSGPHSYPVKNWVGRLSQGNTLQQAFGVLLGRATPFQGGEPSIDNEVINIDGLGPVRQRVDRDRLTIVNTTEPDHVLHPGNVHRSIVQEGDDIYVVTHGYGTGIFPTLNEWAARGIWAMPDHEVRHKLNPYAPLGYPVDEMNAPAAIGREPESSIRLIDPAKPPKGLVTGEPMPDWPVPPPIFGAP